ncbi:hypothetical protein [Bacillus sp. 1P06AnD]|uniref:hypothetical protein n=1 Tax=Bacillus sp. 1P06AnD TaxID=3132208 RepID=UPI0039A35D5E
MAKGDTKCPYARPGTMCFFECIMELKVGVFGCFDDQDAANQVTDRDILFYKQKKGVLALVAYIEF